MPENALIGVDVGTTFIKAVVYAEDLTPLGGTQARTPWSAVSPGIEADPDALAETTIACIERALAAAHRQICVRAIGITGMGEKGVLVDAHDRPVGSPGTMTVAAEKRRPWPGTYPSSPSGRAGWPMIVRRL